MLRQCRRIAGVFLFTLHLAVHPLAPSRAVHIRMQMVMCTLKTAEPFGFNFPPHHCVFQSLWKRLMRYCVEKGPCQFSPQTAYSL